MTDTHLGGIAAELGSGYGGPELIVALRGGQLTKRWAMLGLLVREATLRCPTEVAKSALVETADALAALHASHTTVVENALAYPNTGTWLAYCLQRIRSARSELDDLWRDLGYLGWLTGSVVVEVGTPQTRDIVVRAGRVMLPGIGSAKVAAPEVDGIGQLRVRRPGSFAIEYDTVTVDITDHTRPDLPAWRPLRRMRAGDNAAVEVVIDDLDPFREFNDPTPAAPPHHQLPTLSDHQLGDWSTAFSSAWALLERDHPAHATAILAGLRCFVPLSASAVSPSASRTTYDSFGCIGATAPRNGNHLALTMIHEFQHAKLGALTDLVELYENDPEARFYAPWRDDPRPIEWLMQGMYAHLGVTDFWRNERYRTDSQLAHVEFARWRSQVDRSIAEILSSGILTPDGEDFVAAAAATLRPWLDEPVEQTTARAAVDAGTGHWVAWRIRNLQIPPHALDPLLAAWRSSATARLQDIPPGTATRPDRRSPALRSRLLPCYLQFETPGTDSAPPRDVPPGDIAYGTGDYKAAITHYTREIAAGPLLPQPWAGLALALGHLKSENEISALLERAEVVAQLHARLLESGTSCTPADLVSWLSQSKASSRPAQATS